MIYDIVIIIIALIIIFLLLCFAYDFIKGDE